MLPLAPVRTIPYSPILSCPLSSRVPGTRTLEVPSPVVLGSLASALDSLRCPVTCLPRSVSLPGPFC